MPLGISGFPLTFGFGCLFFYKVSTLFFDCSFWFHQCGIPDRSCRFYCCLAAHQRTKEMDSAEPLSSILWTLTPHPGESAAAGHICCRGFIGIWAACIRCRLFIPTSTWCLGALCSGWYRSRFSRGVGLEAFVFHYWVEKRRCSGSFVVSFFD